MLSNNYRLVKTCIELGIFETIGSFLSKRFDIQTPGQIIRFLELLQIMIASADDEIK